VDVYFDNVGPARCVLPQMNLASRLVCGTAADYNTTEPYGVGMWRSILVNASGFRA
jgi:NADPH-dependent curcumin reductase CurA